MLFVITHKSLMPSVKVKTEFDLVNKFHREIENQQKYLLPACMPLHGYKFIPCACSYRAPSLVSSSIQDFIIGAVAHSSVIIGASLSEPHHVRSTVKFVFLLACLLACMFVCLSPPYMVECYHKYIKSHLSVNHAC